MCLGAEAGRASRPGKDCGLYPESDEGTEKFEQGSDKTTCVLKVTWATAWRMVGLGGVSRETGWDYELREHKSPSRPPRQKS